MTKPKQELKLKEYREQVESLYRAIAGPKGAPQAKKILSYLLTPAEQRMLHRRWHIASLLEAGDNVRQVAQKAKVSTLTVMRIKKLLENSSGVSLRQALTKAGQEKAPAKRVTRRRLRQTSPRLTFGGSGGG